MNRIFCSKKQRRASQLSSLDVDTVPKLPEHPNILFPVRVVRVIDGDTIEIVFLHGGKVPMRICLQIDKVDTPELRSKRLLEKQAAQHVKEKVEKIFAENESKTLQGTFRTWDKYGGRIIGDIHINNKVWLSDHLIFIIMPTFTMAKRKESGAKKIYATSWRNENIFEKQKYL